jgi:hypothetical protein
MLTVALIASVGLTAYCMWAETHPPPRPTPAKTISPATAVIVQMIEESAADFDEDPPTVVQTRSN